METSVNHSMCRCCASEGAFKDVKSTYHWMGEEEIYADMLRDCFDINLSMTEDGDDSGICEVCITQLRNAINFKKQVKHTEEHFKKLVQNKALFRTNIVKIEAAAEDDSEENVSADDGFSGPEYDVPIKTEEEEMKPKKRASTSKITTRSKKAKADSGETSTKSEQEEPIETATIIKETEQVESKDEAKKPRIKMSEEINKNQANVKEILMSSNATPFLGAGYIGFSCCYCDTQCPKPESLKTHNLEMHGDRIEPAPSHMLKHRDTYRVNLDITNLQCKLCETDIKSLEKLLEHLKLEHKRTVHTDIKNRIIPFKFNSEKNLHCCICPTAFDRFKSLLEHMNTHYANYTCNECGKSFITNVSLNAHIKTHKLGVFKCSFCENTYETEVKKKAHEKIVHVLKQSRNKCGFCNNVFQSYMKRNEHMTKVHGIKFNEIKCRVCAKTFASKLSLKDHTRRNHLMERDNKCSQCEMAFYSVAELKDHEVKHSGVKEFKCEVCLKTYPRQKSLKEHMKIHNNDRRFKCDHCGQCFVQKCSLRSHLKLRHGEIV